MATSDVQQLLGVARENESNYNWSKAAERYLGVLELVSEADFQRRGEIHEKIGYAFYRSARQADRYDEFAERLRQSIFSYEQAKTHFGRVSSSENAGWVLRCDAMIAHLAFWLASQPAEKRGHLNESWRLSAEALQEFKRTGEHEEYARTLSQLSLSAALAVALEPSGAAVERIVREALDYTQQWISYLSGSQDVEQTSRAYATALFYLESLRPFVDLDDFDEYDKKAVSYWTAAQGLSEESALIEVSSLGGPGFDFLEGSDRALAIWMKASEYDRRTKDRLVIGNALCILAYHEEWKSTTVDDPDEGKKLLSTALKYAEEARDVFRPIQFTSPFPIPWADAPEAEYFAILAYYHETDPGKIRDALERGLEACPELLRLAEESGYPAVISNAHGMYGQIAGLLGKLEPAPERKRTLLALAIQHTNVCARLTDELQPFMYYNRGINRGALGRFKSYLASLAYDSYEMESILSEAVQQREEGARLCAKHIAFVETRGQLSQFPTLGFNQFEIGDLLFRLYDLTNAGDCLRRAIESYLEAAQSYGKLSIAARMAECHWKAGQAYDRLSNHSKASEEFLQASEYYHKAEERIPRLKSFYQDHALYMQAWSEIEKARYHHAREEYGVARDNHEKAANLLAGTRSWNYLASNHSAWARLEEAEELSREDQSEQATQAFQHAAELFEEARRILRKQLSSMESPEEKTSATKLVGVAVHRLNYCQARIDLEEARVLDKKGDHYSASEKYGRAADTLEILSKSLDSDEDQREVKLIITLSRAWQMMTRAEAEASAQLYVQASQLFEEAKELSSNEKSKMLMLGHSRFCRALEAGAMLADTRDIALHDVAEQHLESTANYYLKAGFPNASEYATATGLLFDAYVHMDTAKKERDPGRKTKLYKMAEIVLRRSANSYVKAEHPEKSEEVQRLLERVKAETELAVSLAEVLEAPSLISATKAFASPHGAHENAVGLERFEHADIQAKVTASHRNMKVGEDLRLEIELVNAGRGPAQLIRVEGLIPDGFELKERPEAYKLEDGSLSLKGRRLDPLKTEELWAVLTPDVKGEFKFSPRIVYLDEGGKYKSQEFEAVTLAVEELGVRGWLKGPEKKR